MRIGILTSFSSMPDFYSLTSVVRTQLKMIHAAGHEPVLITQEHFAWPECPSWVTIRPVIPTHNQIDYMSVKDLTPEHREFVARTAPLLVIAVQDLDAVLTHDLIFTGWNMPIGLAVQQAAHVCGPWLHWIHSVPGGHRDYWVLPPNSVLVYPNETDRVRCAENYRV